MLLNDWAKEFNIPAAAVHALRQKMGIVPDELRYVVEAGASESRVQSQCRLRAAEQGNFLTRNNVGALKDERGVPVRYGLMNDTKELNKVIKSADLIGGRSVLITVEMVGSTILQFYSVECKEADWKYSPNCAHTKAQIAWADFINARGGYAIFATNPGQL